MTDTQRTGTRRDEIVFDRRTGALDAPDLRSHVLVRSLQGAHKMLAPVGYLGISRAHGLIAKIMRPSTTTLVKDGAFQFRFPSNDYYWNRLLDASWSYEPEIDTVLRRFADIPFVFIDLGANFGYWSARVGAGLYGTHRAIAVEASKSCLSALERNVADMPVSVHHCAIDDTSGRTMSLFGDRHAGCSIDDTWYGASKTAVNEVVSITIDDLLAAEGVDCDRDPVIVKLDVEGVELRALAGAARTLAGQSAFIIEDADREGPSDAVRFAVDQLGMSIICIEGDRYTELPTHEDLERVKASQSRIQATGLNLIATRSPFWLAKLRGARAAAEA